MLAAAQGGAAMVQTTRILSLDGGGTWSIIQVRALEAIFGSDTPGHDILAQFDFAVANSGGSIVLGGLAAGLSPRQIATIFTDPANRRAMFVKRPFRFGQIFERLAGIGPRYLTAPKRDALHAHLGAIPFETIMAADGHRTHLVIIAFDYERDRHFFFRSAPSPLVPAVRCALADAVHASTTAPVQYFDAPAEVEVAIGVQAPGPLCLWDGGVTGLNNPAAAALTEALAAGADPKGIVLLSIGTAGVFLPNTRKDRTVSPAYVVKTPGPGLFADLRKLASAVVDDPPDFASIVAHTALGGRSPSRPGEQIDDTRVIRLNPAITPDWNRAIGKWDVGAGLTEPAFTALIGLDIDAVEPDKFALIEDLARQWIADAVRNQPILFNFHQDPDGPMQREIGHDSFGAAVAAWRQLSA